VRPHCAELTVANVGAPQEINDYSLNGIDRQRLMRYVGDFEHRGVCQAPRNVTRVLDWVCCIERAGDQ
jgi:hypothetical protein